jgi:tyrosyl-tRNA synthetase
MADKKLSIDERLNLIREVGEEIIGEDELKDLLEKKECLYAYDGFEPSGMIHIAQGLLRSINVNKMTKAGVKFKMFAADWHAWANNKLGGDLEKIQTCGDYIVEVWKQCGMDLENVEFIRSTNLLASDTYWKTVMEIARASTVKRIVRCSQIMGRSESDSLQASQIIYPCMQCADIFELNVDIAQLGMDQRKVNMLAREVGPKLGFKKPIIVSHHMLMGLTQPSDTGLTGADAAIAKKMSKSNPDSAIFMTDSQKDIVRKFNKAYCPEGQIEDNPVLEYCRYIIFERFDEFLVERPEKFGGNVCFKSYADLEKAFVEKQIHPIDLKQTSAKYINQLIEPVRKHFENDSRAKELLEKVKSYRVTK